MLDGKFENKIRNHADKIFGQGKEPPVGHRERFEQRLKVEYAKTTAAEEDVEAVVTVRKSDKAISLRKVLIAAISTAAVIAGFIMLISTPTEEFQASELADVRNYYNMRLEEQIDATKLLIQNIDEPEHRDVLLANIEHIKSITVPDVQITDDEYIVLIASVYTNKIETLQNLQDLLREYN